MNIERWEQIKTLIHTQYEIEYEEVEDLPENLGTMEVIEFVGPLGPMRVEYATKQRQIGRKVIASTRIGSTAHEEILHSKTEQVNFLKVYTWNEEEEDWEEV